MGMGMGCIGDLVPSEAMVRMLPDPEETILQLWEGKSGGWRMEEGEDEDDVRDTHE